jgi:hypothetical protein
MKKAVFLIFIIGVLSSVSNAQKEQKPWPEWTKEDIDKILNKSPWGHTVTGTDTSEMNVTMGVSDINKGANNQAMNWNYHIMFFSAKPVREALARRVLLANPNLKASQLENFINGDYSETIVVAVTFDSTDRRYLGEIEKAFNSATAELLQGKVYIELKDGKHVLVQEYAPPSKDGTGAKFVFPRSVDGNPFVTDPKDVLHFVANLGNGVSMDWRFKLSDMTYEGRLEY